MPGITRVMLLGRTMVEPGDWFFLSLAPRLPSLLEYFCNSEVYINPFHNYCCRTFPVLWWHTHWRQCRTTPSQPHSNFPGCYSWWNSILKPWTSSHQRLMLKRRISVVLTKWKECSLVMQIWIENWLVATYSYLVNTFFSDLKMKSGNFFPSRWLPWLTFLLCCAVCWSTQLDVHHVDITTGGSPGQGRRGCHSCHSHLLGNWLPSGSLLSFQD